MLALLLCISCVQAVSPHTASLHNRLRAKRHVVKSVNLRFQQVHDGTSFKAVEYNILADAYATNTRPYLFYFDGSKATLDDKTREKYIQEFNSRQFDETKVDKKVMAAVKEYQEAFFAWDKRKDKIITTIKSKKPDVLVLVEEDHADFFKTELAKLGLDEAKYAQRPGRKDGAGIYFNKKIFTVQASGQQQFGEEAKKTTQKDWDRLYAWAVLETVAEPKSSLLVIATHLMRNPEDAALEKLRVAELKMIDEFIAKEVKKKPHLNVLVMGDFNAEPTGDAVKYITTTAGQKLSDAAQAKGVTGATSVTLARDVRIDYALNNKELTPTAFDAQPESSTLKTKTHGIPDATHPSDHIPIGVTFKLGAGTGTGG